MGFLSALLHEEKGRLLIVKRTSTLRAHEIGGPVLRVTMRTATMCLPVEFAFLLVVVVEVGDPFDKRPAFGVWRGLSIQFILVVRRRWVRIDNEGNRSAAVGNAESSVELGASRRTSGELSGELMAIPARTVNRDDVLLTLHHRALRVSLLGAYSAGPALGFWSAAGSQ